MVQNSAAKSLGAAETELRAGRWRQARELAVPFLDDSEHGLRARSVMANAAMQTGDYTEAVNHLTVLHEALPANRELRTALSVMLNNLGSAALQKGSVKEAEGSYRKALEIDDRNAMAWFNLAACAQKRNDFSTAAQAYERCVKLDPSRSEARFHWAVCERVRGNARSASTALSGVEDAQLPAGLAVNIGTEWTLLGDTEQAGRAWSSVTRAAEADAGLLLRVASACLQAGEVGDAKSSARRAAASTKDAATSLKASLLAALGLPAVPRDQQEVEQSRHEFADGIATLSADWPPERLATGQFKLSDLAHSHYLLAYQGKDDTALAKAFGRWYSAAAHAVAAAELGSELTPGRVNQRRIALVSARWNTGTINAYFGSWVSALGDAGWDVSVFHLGAGVDVRAAAVASGAAKFHHLPGSLAEAVPVIQATAPAMIIYPEIGLSPATHALAALRLAPVQAAAWGHPVTTGLTSMDAYFSCAAMEPDNAADHYNEALVLLPGLGTRYQRPQRAGESARDEHGLPQGHPLYLVPHAAVKIQPQFDALLAGIAERDRQARFIMFEDSVPALTKRLQRRIGRYFDQHGLDAQKHLTWLPRLTPTKFRSLLAGTDVLLDTPGFSGGNTSLDAIGQGLPLVALPGANMRGRQSAAMLDMCGAGELIAATAGQYVEIAVRVANDVEYAARMRQNLLAPGSTLFDDRRPLEVLVERVEQLIASA